MKKYQLLLPLMLCLSSFTIGQTAGNKNDTSHKKAGPSLDRNMFGRGLTRGLKINGDGLADGYILFAEPNSASGLLNYRKGDEVHSWKSNYGNFIPADHPALKGKKLEPLYPQPAVYVVPPQGNIN